MANHLDRNVSVSLASPVTIFTAIFVTLKLCGVIDWSWWWVLSPLWVPLALAGSFFAAILSILAYDEWREGR